MHIMYSVCVCVCERVCVCMCVWACVCVFDTSEHTHQQRGLKRSTYTHKHTQKHTLKGKTTRCRKGRACFKLKKN